MEKPYQLPKEFAEKWIAALRSGEYRQGTGQFFDKTEQCYCSLGLGLLANNIPLADGNNGLDNYPALERIIPSRIQAEIISLNDDRGLPFSEIADWIEQNVDFI